MFWGILLLLTKIKIILFSLVWWFLPDETTYQLLRLCQGREEKKQKAFLIERERERERERTVKEIFPRVRMATAMKMGSQTQTYHFNFNYSSWFSSSFSLSSSSGTCCSPSITSPSFLFRSCPHILSAHYSNSCQTL